MPITLYTTLFIPVRRVVLREGNLVRKKVRRGWEGRKVEGKERKEDKREKKGWSKIFPDCTSLKK